MNNGNSNNNYRYNSSRVRPVCVVCPCSSSANEPVTYDISFSSVVEAFEHCVNNKKSAKDCIDFHKVYQSELLRIWKEMREGRYRPGKSFCFVVLWPVPREIFAAYFADRVVHHWWAMRVNSLFENFYNEMGNVTFNCRKGFGLKAAVERAQSIVDGHPDWWVGRFDWQGYFMHISKQILWEMVSIFLEDNYNGKDKECVVYISRTFVFHCPQFDCIRKSPLSYWNGIPSDKSLFGQPVENGGPIGNWYMQLSANFFAAVFDYWMLRVKNVPCFLRFVDDFLVFMPRKEDILELVPEMREYLSSQLRITLHPKKIYIQPVRHGFLWVGAYVMPGRVYISNRTRGRMYDCIRKYNALAAEGKAQQYLEKFVASMNSYLGMMVHYNSYNVRKKIMPMLAKEWWQYIMFDGKFRKLIIKKQYKTNYQLRQIVKNGDYKALLTPLLEEVN